MHAVDLTAYNYKLPFSLTEIVMVGWLDKHHAFNIGRVDDALVLKLWQMIRFDSAQLDLHVNIIRGVHECNLCGREIFDPTGGTKPHVLGMSEIWIPHTPVWFAAPSLVVHYIEEHGYAPPSSFIRAIDEFDPSSNVIAQSKYDQAIAHMAMTQ